MEPVWPPICGRAGARSVQINVADPELGHPFGVSPDAEVDQLAAVVSAWVDTAEGTRIGPALPGRVPGGTVTWSANPSLCPTPPIRRGLTGWSPASPKWWCSAARPA